MWWVASTITLAIILLVVAYFCVRELRRNKYYASLAKECMVSREKTLDMMMKMSKENDNLIHRLFKFIDNPQVMPDEPYVLVYAKVSDAFGEYQDTSILMSFRPENIEGIFGSETAIQDAERRKETELHSEGMEIVSEGTIYDDGNWIIFGPKDE